jgi:endonuclease/exonuclease/phosphatase family metal-dependent hydrolase
MKYIAPLTAAFRQGHRSKVIKSTIQRLLAFLLITMAVNAADIKVINTGNSATQTRLNIISWNLEHFAQKEHQGCKPRAVNDYRQLKNFADSLNADIVALQEVESKQAAHKLFPPNEWTIEISNRASSQPYQCRKSKKSKKKQYDRQDNQSTQWSTQQKVAIAIRKGIKYKRKPDLKQLGLGIEGLRIGVQIEIHYGQKSFDLLALHLKSGCFVDNYARSRKEACHLLAKQAAILDSWVEKRVTANKEFILLGDFNHRISAPYNTLWRDLNYMKTQSLDLFNNMRDMLNCHPYYPAPIDHILISKQLSRSAVSDSQQVYYYPHKNKMKKRDMLSDHCPIGVKLVL